MENQNIEWKEKWKDDYLKWICAFANSTGGTLYVGVDDTGKVKGLKDAKRLLFDIPNKVKEYLGIIVNIKLVTKKNLDYLIIRVNKYPIPISFKGKYYMRSGSNTYEVMGNELDNLILKKVGRTYDDLRVKDYNLSNISSDAVDYFKNLSIKNNKIDKNYLDVSNEMLFRNLRILDDDGISLAGILLFSKDPSEYVKNPYVKLGMFGKDESVLKFESDVNGPIILQIENTINLLFSEYYNYLKSDNGITNYEYEIISRNIIREVLINALMFKDYNNATPIQIKVFNDRTTISNIVGSSNKLIGNNIYMPHPSYLVNPNISNVFNKCGLATLWGKGYERIKKECEENNSHIPGFKVNKSSVQVKCKYNEDFLRFVKGDLKSQSEFMKRKELLREIENSNISNEELKLLLKKNKHLHK